MICVCEFLYIIEAELTTIIVLSVQVGPLNTVLNFLALQIITQFEEIVFQSLHNDKTKILVKKENCAKVFVIKRTTSSRCGSNEYSVDHSQDSKVKLRLEFKERTCCNKVQFCIYKIFRVGYVSIYYYFLPFLVVSINIHIPIRFAFWQYNHPQALPHEFII